jgi:Ca-activated chloride channel family protein
MKTKQIALMLGLAASAAMVGCSTPETTEQQPDHQAAELALPTPQPALEEGIQSADVIGQRQLSSLALQPASGRLHPEAHPYWAMSQDREKYQNLDENPIRRAAENPVSTFSVDVDTSSYANVRRLLNSGRLPPSDAVRVEELINYFGYDYPVPTGDDNPFSVNIEQAITPWNPDTRLIQIGIRGFEPPRAELPPANLVFLVDVSGSMNGPDRLGLVINGLKLLTGQLTEQDRIAIVVYAARTAVVL